MRRSGPWWSSSCVGAPLFGQLAAARGSVRGLARLRAGDAGAVRARVVLLAHDVQVQLDARLAVLDDVEETLDVLGRLVRVPKRLARSHLPALHPLEDRRQRPE